MKKIILFSALLLSSSVNATVTASSSSEIPSGCRAYHHCDIPGHHNIEVTNDSAIPKSYGYIYSLCIMRMQTETDCQYVHNVITLQPYQHWVNHHESMIRPRLSDKGKYTYRVLTSIDGAEKSIDDKRYIVELGD